jgi:prepilin-type N-terminal cleavage/methylation domain-containing protein
MRTIARLRSRDEGFTFTELLVAMMVMALASGVFLTTLASVQKSVVETDIRTRSNTQARLAMQTLDHEVRSGNLLYDPESYSGSDRYFRFKVYTQANASTRQPSPGYTCRLWRITEDDELQTRWWEPYPADPDATASPWRTVATSIVNRSTDLPIPAFVLDDDPNKGGRTVNVVFVVNEDVDGDLSTGTVKIQGALTGRNTSYGFPIGVCSTEPAD